MKSFHQFVLREVNSLTEKITGEVIVLKDLKRMRDTAFKEFKRELTVSELRVFVIMEQFAALEGQCTSFDQELDNHLTSVRIHLDTSKQGVWYGSMSSRFQCIERMYDYKLQLMEAMNDANKIYAELIILHDHLIASIDGPLLIKPLTST